MSIEKKCEIEYLTKKEIELFRFLLAFGRQVMAGEVCITFHNREPQVTIIKDIKFILTGHEEDFEKHLTDLLALLKSKKEEWTPN